MTKRPCLLSMPNVPKPLHGLNPRVIMGKEKWDILRQKVYASTDYHCAACGTHKQNARYKKWLEAHEVYDINYQKGEAVVTEIVPLCHFCHSFIHSGRLRKLARRREVSAEHVRNIMKHGVATLIAGDCKIFAGSYALCKLVRVDTFRLRIIKPQTKVALWSDWEMVWDGVRYKGKYGSFMDWKRAYS